MTTTTAESHSLRQIARFVRQSSRRVEGLIRVRKLEAPSQLSAALKRAISDSLTRSVSTEERAWIERIEAQRQAMVTSVQPLRFEDFGAKSDGAAIDDADPSQGPAMVETTLGEMTRVSSSKPQWGLFLFRLVRTMRPEAVLELGTCVGISAAYIGAALEANQSGRMITLEGGKSLAERSRHTISELGLSSRVTVVHGPFATTLGPALRDLSSVDLAFIDGHHQEEPTIHYTEELAPYLAEQAVVAYDDIHWSAGMLRSWNRLQQDPRCSMSIDLGGMGLIARGSSISSSVAHAVIPFA